MNTMRVPGTYLFIGENSFQLQRDTLRWKEQFAHKYGPENMLVVSGREQTPSTLADAIGVMPFIAEKRLVICEGLPKFAKGQLEQALAELHPSTILLFAEPVPDKRLTTYKEAMECIGEIKEYPLMKGVKLTQWMEQEARQNRAAFAPAAAKALLDVVGEDQWLLASEIRKLALMSSGNITVALIESAVIPSGEQVVWKLTDMIGSGKTVEALRYLQRCIERGEDAYGLWVILLSMVKNLCLVWSALDHGVAERDIASNTGLHFLAVRSLMPLARTMNARGIDRLVSLAMRADIALKTGGLKYKAEEAGEVIAAAEEIILSCAA